MSGTRRPWSSKRDGHAQSCTYRLISHEELTRNKRTPACIHIYFVVTVLVLPIQITRFIYLCTYVFLDIDDVLESIEGPSKVRAMPFYSRQPSAVRNFIRYNVSERAFAGVGRLP